MATIFKVSSDGMGRRNGSDKGGDGKADADVVVMVGLRVGVGDN